MKEATSESSMEDEYAFSTLTGQLKFPKFKFKINRITEVLMADMGSSVNFLDQENFNRLKKTTELLETTEKTFLTGQKNYHLWKKT